MHHSGFQPVEERRTTTWRTHVQSNSFVVQHQISEQISLCLPTTRFSNLLHISSGQEYSKVNLNHNLRLFIMNTSAKILKIGLTASEKPHEALVEGKPMRNVCKLL